MVIQVDGTTVIDQSRNYSGGGVSSVSNYRITNPGGAEYISTSGTLTGALQITLPVGYTNTMMRMTIKVYLYNPNESFDVICGGYNYATSPSWINTFAYIVGNPSAERLFNVRFGFTAGGKCCVYIGELTTAWSFPQFSVTDVQLGYSGISSTWVSGWAAGIASAFENVTSTVAGWGRLVATDRQTASLQDASGGLGGIELRSSGVVYSSPGVPAPASQQPAAFMTFHRPGAFAGYFGLDGDNQFAVGGWSYGSGLGYLKVGSLGVGVAACTTSGSITTSSGTISSMAYRNFTYTTTGTNPSGGSAGDVWVQYNA
jgi:hypothetical protein